MKPHFYSSERNVQIVISLLKSHGIKKVVTSPGMTNITFVASIQTDPFFELYSCVDERSAAYMACGMAAETGEPIVLSCTGATASRKGYFESADGGTLFLDEVGELPLSTQARLLRVLETGEFIKVGSSKVEKSDVRVVAATNMNMIRAVEKGKFREDLYYRLNFNFLDSS